MWDRFWKNIEKAYKQGEISLLNFGSQALIYTLIKTLKKDKQYIDYKRKMASSLNDYKLDDQTFNLVGKTKKGIFPVQTKFKVNSTRDSYASEDPWVA